MNEKIKVTNIDIIVEMINDRPYYELKYKELGNNYYCIGYASYDLDNVIRWKKEYFEKVEEEQKSQWIPISERLPEDESYILVSFENCTMPDIARYEENDEGGAFYPGDDEKILFELWNICQCLDAIAGAIQGGKINNAQYSD